MQFHHPPTEGSSEDRSSCKSRNTSERTEDQSKGCEKMVLKRPSVDSRAPPKTHNKNDSENKTQSSSSFFKTNDIKDSMSERLNQPKPLSNGREELQLTPDSLHSHDISTKPYIESSVRVSSNYGEQVKETKNTHPSCEERIYLSPTPDTFASKNSPQPVHRFSLDSRLGERSQKPVLKKYGCIDKGEQAYKSPSRKSVSFYSDKTGGEEKSETRLCSHSPSEQIPPKHSRPDEDGSVESAHSGGQCGQRRKVTYRRFLSEDSWRYVFDDDENEENFTTNVLTSPMDTSPPADLPETPKESSVKKTSPDANCRHSPSESSRRVCADDRLSVALSPERGQGREFTTDTIEISDRTDDPSDQIVRDFHFEQSASKCSSHSGNSHSVESSSPHSSQSGYPMQCDSQSAHNSSRSSERHVGDSSKDRTKHKNSVDNSSEQSVTKDDEQTSLRSSSHSVKHENLGSDKDILKSSDFKNRTAEHRSSTDSHASLESDPLCSKSHRNSHSDKHGSASSDRHTTKNSNKSVHWKLTGAGERRASEDFSPRRSEQSHLKSQHRRHSDGQANTSNMEGQTNPSKKQTACENETKKSVSKDGSHSRHSLHDSISEDDGLNVGASISPGYVTSPDILSENENKSSEKHSPTTGDEKDSSFTDSGSTKTPPSSKSGDVKGRRRSNSEGHSSSEQKSHKPAGSRKHSIEIKPISVIVNESSGYVTSPDISSEDEEEEEEKGDEERSAGGRVQRRESTNSQSGSEVGPAALTKHQLKPTLDRQGGSYEERLKVMEKLMAVRQRMDENETGYHRKRAARGDVKKRRARREKLEGDFSGPCRDKIEYNLEDKPSLRRPEPKPEEPKPEKRPKKEKAEKPKKEKKEKKDRSESKQRRKSKENGTPKSKPRSKDCRDDSDNETPRKEKKRRNRSRSVPDEDDEPRAKATRKRICRPASSDSSKEDSVPPSDVPAPRVQQADFLKMKSMWDTLFGGSKKTTSETPATSADSETDTTATASKKTVTEEDEEDDGEMEDIDVVHP